MIMNFSRLAARLSKPMHLSSEYEACASVNALNGSKVGICESPHAVLAKVLTALGEKLLEVHDKRQSLAIIVHQREIGRRYERDAILMLAKIQYCLWQTIAGAREKLLRRCSLPAVDGHGATILE